MATYFTPLVDGQQANAATFNAPLEELDAVLVGIVGGGTALASPTISSFANAGHNHTNAANGGQLTDAALSAAVSVAKGGTGATTAADARTNLGLGTIATQAADSVDIDGGAIDGTVIGASSAAAGTFTVGTMDQLIFSAASTLTISSGAVTAGARTFYLIDTEGAAASDDLDTINGGADGELLIIRGASAARIVTVMHNTGNIQLFGAADIALDALYKVLLLQYHADTSKWVQVGGGASTGGGGGGAPTDATYITQTPNGTLSAEQALSTLATGLLKNTGGTGVLSIATASDLPSHNHAASDINSGQLELERGGTEADLGATGPGLLRQATAGAAVSNLKCNYAATAAPTTGDDSGDGYAVGSFWWDTTKKCAYVCLDATVGAAVWRKIDDYAIGCRVHHSANQSIANGATTALVFDSERFDTDSLHSTSSNTSRLTASVAGLWMIFASVQFATNATGLRSVMFRMNGTDVIAHDKRNATSAQQLNSELMTVYSLAASDYVECEVVQTSGGALNVEVQDTRSPEFGMIYLGKAS